MHAANSIATYQAPRNLLKDRVIVVTGAGSGIGRSAALAYARHGATVILVGKTLEKLEAVYDDIENAKLSEAAIVPIDFENATEQDYRNIFESIENTFGRVDGLLNNAATLGGALSPLENQSLSQWQSVFNVNLNAVFMMTRTLLPLLKKSAASSVIFTSSEVGRAPRAFWGAYAISKCACEHMMLTFSDELQSVSTVRFNSIDPGPVCTAMRGIAFPAEDPNTLPSSDEIMNSYLYLMGDDSKDFSGVQFNAQ